MGPGYQSAYGLVMGIHIDPKRGGFDNQIRTHGSVDYTSIARRFSHGCHRLVNNRAVRLFDFVLRHRPFRRDRRRAAQPQEAASRSTARRTTTSSRRAATTTSCATRSPVNVLEGRVMGEVKKPITAYVRKPGVDYEDANMGVGDAAASTAIAAPGRGPESGP